VNAHWTLPCAASSVTFARGALRGLLEDAGSSADERDAAAMVITELMANAIIHSGRSQDQIVVTVASSDRQIRIEVEDRNPRPPVPRDIDVDAPFGRGLMIVDALSSAWGWDAIDGDGKRVWCDVPRTGTPSRGRAMPGHAGPAAGVTPRL
jgi:serine/threonine-protein kinase RsbW